jgi:chromosome partitioning protein
MLDWFKRIATTAAQEQPVDEEDQTGATEEKLERLIGRLRARTHPDEPGGVPPIASPAAPEPVRIVRPPEAARQPPVAPVRGSADMRVVVVASQKGGSGKTTLAAHLAVQAGLAGDGPAVVIDADWQGSLSEWWCARNDDALALATVIPGDMTETQADELAAHLVELRRRGLAVAAMREDGIAAHLTELRHRGVAVVIIDTPPSRTGAIEQVIGVADLVLIPARPSPHDLRSIGATVDMARRAEKPLMFVVNGAVPRAGITVQAVTALSEQGPVAPTVISQRTEFATSMIDGRTVMETDPDGKSAQEIGELWKVVQERVSLPAAA